MRLATSTRTAVFTMVNSILVPTDFSPTSDAALRYAAQMALALGARLFLMHVPGKTGEHLEASYPVEQFGDVANGQLGSFLTAEEVGQLRPLYAIRVGTPAEEIALYADACGIDLIVMGTHGRSGLAHAVLGSIAEQVVRTAPCPVLLVRSSRAVTSEAPAVEDVPVRPPRWLESA
jgi:nucleotide-binding universal stress UspA family protein